MCVIISGKAKDIKHDEIKKALAQNPDGNGFIMVHSDGKVDWAKGVDVTKLYEVITDNPNSYIAIHARIATSGGISKAMTHPFASPSGRYLLMHNGILRDSRFNGTAKVSDTAQLAGLLDDEAIRGDLSAIAKNNSSRFVLVDSHTGEVRHYGKWTMTDDVSRSNENHLNTYNYNYGYSRGYTYNTAGNTNKSSQTATTPKTATTSKTKSKKAKKTTKTASKAPKTVARRDTTKAYGTHAKNDYSASGEDFFFSDTDVQDILNTFGRDEVMKLTLDFHNLNEQAFTSLSKDEQNELILEAVI